MLKCKVEGRNLISGVEQEFNIAEGAVFTENFNETLDSGTIILPQLFSEIEIEPYDVIVITDINNRINTRRLCVDTYVCTQTSLDPAIYKYEISLFSETKMLEGILLPSLSIKRKQTGNLTIYGKIQEYLDEYSPKLNSTEYGVSGNKYTLASSVMTKFNSDICPEMNWNEPNLKEVITDLMMVKNCIPVVKNNVIYYMDMSPNLSDLTAVTSEQLKSINYIRKSQSSADYVSEIKTRIQNSIGEDEKTSICEKITWRNYADYILTTENIKVETSYPIWQLKKFYMWLPFPLAYFTCISQDPNAYQEIKYFPTYVPLKLYDSLNKKVLEYGEWQTKDIYYAGNNQVHPYSTDYQNTCLYYKRGEKGIFNFNAKQEKIGFFWVPYQKSILDLLTDGDYFDTTYIENYITAEFLEAYPEYATGWSIQLTYEVQGVDWKHCSFECEYETLGEYTMFASKGKIPRNKRQIVDNQTQNYVNARAFGVLEYLKANRLGNKLLLINGRYTGIENSMPQLTNKINTSSIIFSKEIAVYDNYIKVNYQATEDYILRDYYTGVKSKIRSWKILSGNEALVRNDNLKFYINDNIQSIDNINYKLPVYQTLQEYIEKFNYCVVKFYSVNNYGNNVYYPNGNEIKYTSYIYGDYTSNVDGYMMEFTKIISGNSVLFSFKALDNAIVGKYVCADNYDIGNNVKCPTQKNCPYVDENGENYGGVIYFYQNYSLNGKETEDIEALDNLLPATHLTGTKSGLSNLVAKIPFNFHKDNGEITQITIEFEMNESANDIFLGKK